MRKGLVCSIMLCSLAALGQNVPQWKVVKVAHLQGGGDSGLRSSTLLLPKRGELCRVTAYLGSANLYLERTGWYGQIVWTDRTGLTANIPFSLVWKNGTGAFTAVNPTIFTVQANTPVVVTIQPTNPPPLNESYDLIVIIEKLTNEP